MHSLVMSLLYDYIYVNGNRSRLIKVSAMY